MTSTPDRIPSRLRDHYCRSCGQLFERGPLSESIAPHAQAWIHRKREHKQDLTDYASCSKYCAQVAQPEELEQARRMYGAGVRRPTTVLPGLKTYAELFPDDEED
jgi:TorA maturation chaperone TorD